MLKISFISTGTTSSQTPVMATVSYELVKRWIKDNPGEIPDFPLACIFDYSSMYSTIQFFATDKILMRMGELSSLTEEMKKSAERDWSKCSFPSKFAHKETNEPLFFMIPVFERAVSISLNRSETLDLAKYIWEITQTIEQAGTRYMFFDLPLIEPREKKLFELSALLNSNLIIAVIDMDKISLDKVISEISTLENFLHEYNTYAKTPLMINGLIFNKITDKVLSEKWMNNVMKEFPKYPVIGMIREDSEFTKAITNYEIPTVDALFHKMKSGKDFIAAAEMISQISSDVSSLRNISGEEQAYFEEKIFK